MPGGRTTAPAPSARYTPPVSVTFRVRPLWHKVIGALLILVGAALVVINYLDYSADILPGGHQEAYFLLGIIVAASSSWWFGAFDREPSPQDVRRAFADDKR